MKQRFASVLISLSLIACNQALRAPSIYSVVPEVEPYVLRFKAEGAKRGWDIPLDNLVVRFASLGTSPLGQTIGECNMHAEPPRVNLDWNWWRVMPDASREEVVFHELGHCLLRREHTTAVVHYAGGIAPYSIMNPVAIDAVTYVTLHVWYLDELFGNAPVPVRVMAKEE